MNLTLAPREIVYAGDDIEKYHSPADHIAAPAD
jgi:hypothetical protein